MTIETLAAKRMPHTQIARNLGVAEGRVFYHLKRIAARTVNGRSRQELRANPEVSGKAGGPLHRSTIATWTH